MYCNCAANASARRLYPQKLPFLDRLFPNRHIMECESVTTSLLRYYNGLSVYGQLIKDLKNQIPNSRVLEFSYNFYLYRRSLPLVVQDLERLLNQMVLSGDHLVLIGHSMGALIVRILLEHRNWWQWNPHHLQVFLCGAPSYGSMNPLDYGVERCLFADYYHWTVGSWERTNSPERRNCNYNVMYPPSLMPRGILKRFIKTNPVSIQLLLPTYVVLDHQWQTRLELDHQTIAIHGSLTKGSTLRYVHIFSNRQVSMNRFYFYPSHPPPHGLKTQCNYKIVPKESPGEAETTNSNPGPSESKFLVCIQENYAHDGQIITPRFDHFANCRIVLTHGGSHARLMDHAFVRQHICSSIANHLISYHSLSD